MVLPSVKSIEYFSDGCAGQYKNYKNLLNLTYHQQDFKISVNWNFFATSHGKSPCDDLGGAIKRKLTNESLKRPQRNQITTPQQCFEESKKLMPSTHFISKVDMIEYRHVLAQRFEYGQTVPGTRSFHVFSPQEIGVVSYKWSPDDKEFSGTFHFFKKSTLPEINPSIGDFVAANCDEHWRVGMVLRKDSETDDVLIKLMTPHGPNSNFTWPIREYSCWVPKSDILRILQVPSTSSSGRSYQLDNSDYLALLDTTR